MTTSILSPENEALVAADVQAPVVQPAYTTYRIRHTLASRFAFLIVCVAIVLSGARLRRGSLLVSCRLFPRRRFDNGSLAD